MNPLILFDRPGCASLSFCVLDTEERPFECPVCGNRYRRQDVFRRHLKNNCDQGLRRTSVGRRRRIQRACDRCRAQKLKCDGNPSCHRCVSKLVDCSYSETGFDPTESQTPDPFEDLQEPALNLNHPQPALNTHDAAMRMAVYDAFDSAKEHTQDESPLEVASTSCSRATPASSSIPGLSLAITPAYLPPLRGVPVTDMPSGTPLRAMCRVNT